MFSKVEEEGNIRLKWIKSMLIKWQVIQFIHRSIKLGIGGNNIQA